MFRNRECCRKHDPGGWTCAECRYVREPITVLVHDAANERCHLQEKVTLDGFVTNWGLGYYSVPCSSVVEVNGFVLACLMNHWDMPGDTPIYIPTHLLSGEGFGVGLLDEQETRAWLEAIANCANWRLPRRVLILQRHLIKRIKWALDEITANYVFLQEAGKSREPRGDTPLLLAGGD